FKAEGKETVEQTFNRLQAIVSHLEFMDVEIKQDDLNQNDLYNHLKVYEPEVQKKSESNSQNMAFFSSAKNSSGNGEVNTASIPNASTQVSHASANVAPASISLDTACAYIASQSNGSHIKYEDINQIDEDDIEEMDIKWNTALLSMRVDRYWMKTGKKISIQGSVGPPGAKKRVEEKTTDKEENHALVVDEEAPTEFSLMAKSSTDNEVFDNSLCSKAYKKNTDSLNSKIIELSEKLGDTKNMLYHYKLETLKKEKEGLDSKLTGFKSASKDLDNLLESQRSDKNKEGPSPIVESNLNDLQNNSSSVSEIGESNGSILSKPEIKFVKATNSPTVVKTNKDETVRKTFVKYAEMCRKNSKMSNVRGNQRNWNNLKS
nr:hypothetical protein [Tanacetum cinerariifolium]